MAPNLTVKEKATLKKIFADTLSRWEQNLRNASVIANSPDGSWCSTKAHGQRQVELITGSLKRLRALADRLGINLPPPII